MYSKEIREYILKERKFMTTGQAKVFADTASHILRLCIADMGHPCIKVNTKIVCNDADTNIEFYTVEFSPVYDTSG